MQEARATTAIRIPAVEKTLLALIVGYAWALLLWHLSIFWRVLQDYEYGWAVPPLLVILLLRRGKQLPPAQPTNQATSLIGVALCVVALLPLRVILDANLDWRIGMWALAVLTIAITLFAVNAIGSKAWVRVLAFPILFILTGVPWPGHIEIPLTTGLMRFGAFVATELLNQFGIFADQQGSVVETAAGLIGVDEACSGIKSLQTMVMIALFLSDFTALRGLFRFWIVVFGAILAMVTNLIRIIVLAFIGTQAGSQAVDSWHDITGALAFGAACLLLIILARFLPGSPSKPNGSGVPVVQAGETASDRQIGRRPFFRLVLAGCVLWLAGAEALRLWWFQSNQPAEGRRWTAIWPESGVNQQPVKVSDSIRGQLQCDVGDAMSWTREPGTKWIGYFFEWKPGVKAYFARSQHAPEICLPATGRRLLQDLGYFDYKVGKIAVRIRHEVFEDETGPINVFFIMDGSAVRSVDEQLKADSVTGRLQGVWHRSKEADRRSMELIGVGYHSPQAAEESAKEWFSEIITPQIEGNPEVQGS
jgi:exosortase